MTIRATDPAEDARESWELGCQLLRSDDQLERWRGVLNIERAGRTDPVRRADATRVLEEYVAHHQRWWWRDPLPVRAARDSLSGRMALMTLRPNRVTSFLRDSTLMEKSMMVALACMSLVLLIGVGVRAVQ